MPSQKFPHILLPSIAQIESYKRKPIFGTTEYTIPEREPLEHGKFLKDAYASALEDYRTLCEQSGISSRRLDEGFTVEVKAPENIGLEYMKLEDMRGKEKLEVLNVRFDSEGKVTSAVIYIPPQKIKTKSFTKKIDAYQDHTKNTQEGPRHRTLFNTIDGIAVAVLQAFWVDNTPFPVGSDQHSWELWLRDETIDNVRKAVDALEGIQLSGHHLQFPDRQICIAYCNILLLRKLQLTTNALTGFRYNRTMANFFVALEPREQKKWQDELIDHITYDMQNSSVCILDTGLYGEHKLLKPAIQQGAIDTYDPNWGKDDHDGHGTEMAGLALLGDLTPLLSGKQNIDVQHYLESVKVFPRSGSNLDDHVALITEESVYRAETNFPKLDRVFCLSWTMYPVEVDGIPIKILNGLPTALSAKIDQMSFGTDSMQDWQVDDSKKRLFFISAGNIQDQLTHSEYPDKNDISEVLEPAQSWNAVTVGAYTNKVWVGDQGYNEWEPVAKVGELSPRSRTSVSWGKRSWPIKPDIVLEGGNYIGKENFSPEDHPDLHVLTTGKNEPLCHSSDTSAANAQAARLGAMIRAKYPNYWPETVRGLLVHAASWTPAMLQQGVDPVSANMQEKITLLRRYGYGVPDTELILSSFNNKPCIIIQDYLKPFKRDVDAKGEERSYLSYDTMNFYELPWPKEQLKKLFDKNLKLRITLSYFIEPNPSERPPRTKYSYASHDLRFKLQRFGESHEQFLQRINAEIIKADAHEDASEDTEITAIKENNRGQDKWLLGPKVRDRGSLISDIWTGTGVELAEQNTLAVVPQGGWWKYRLKFPDENKQRYLEPVRFSLILSLETKVDVDIYTPITEQIAASILV